MNEKEKSNVDANSAEFKQGVADGLNSAEDTKDWKAGHELGQELKHEVKSQETVHEVPLFLRGSADEHKGNAQDEKDAMEE